MIPSRMMDRRCRVSWVWSGGKKASSRSRAWAALMECRVLSTRCPVSAKYTTLAAMVDLINQRRTAHVITLEDPIEFLHPDKRSLVSQREVATDTPSFHHALRAALRQAPDVLLIGEMRDRESADAALRASPRRTPA
ncbi:MAG: hypothetical protein C4304_09990 [candidate division GAL15 bacterium]